MPIYEYSCKGCQSSFSLLQKVGADENDVKCTVCGSNNVKKLFSTFSCSSSTGNSLAGLPSPMPSSGG